MRPLCDVVEVRSELAGEARKDLKQEWDCPPKALPPPQASAASVCPIRHLHLFVWSENGWRLSDGDCSTTLHSFVLPLALRRTVTGPSQRPRNQGYLRYHLHVGLDEVVG